MIEVPIWLAVIVGIWITLEIVTFIMAIVKRYLEWRLKREMRKHD